MPFWGERSVLAWLGICFGVSMPPKYKVIPQEELHSEQRAAPKSPKTNWRELPLLQQFNLVKQIGKGGFSQIWLAERRPAGDDHSGLGAGAGAEGGVHPPPSPPLSSKSPPALVAIKAVHLTNPDLEPEEVATLLAEAKILMLLDCPYLLRCYETTASDDWLVLVLEYLSGGEMMEQLHKATKYTEATAAMLFAQVVSAISYLHNLNIIHRDIKPENVMFCRPVEECEAEGQPLRVKVIDLGMGALYDENKPIRSCIGTPGFISPEIWNDGPHTPACDIYALGVVLFIMLTGRKPHSGMDIRMMTYCNKSIREAPGIQDERFLSLSPSARELLLDMLSDDPRARPSCRDVLRHPFITAVDSNSLAHREMEESVRRRMSHLVQLRHVHGLRYALRLSKPHGGDHYALLHELEQRRLKLMREMVGFRRVSDVGFRRPSSTAATTVGHQCTSTTPGSRDGPAPAFDKCSLALSYTSPPLLLMNPNHNPSSPFLGASMKAGAGTGVEVRVGRGARVASVDSMAIVNALPHLHHCFSADGVLLKEIASGDGERNGDRAGATGSEQTPNGGSPLEPDALVERPPLTRCMSANQDTLELLRRQETLEQLMDAVVLGQPAETGTSE